MSEFDNMSTQQYDESLNEIAKELFTDDKELDQERTRLTTWAIANLLISKGLITEAEYEKSVEEATTFFKLLKRRHRILKDSEQSE